MNKAMLKAVSAVTAISCVLGAVPAQAERHDNRGHERHDNGRHNGQNKHWQTWGGNHGYQGYHGKWRTGQRYTNWRNTRYYINDYRTYNLPPPRPGYRYYRDSSGDIVLAAVATGVIAAILSSGQ